MHITVDDESRTLEVDNVVVCAGQLSENSLVAPLEAAGLETHVIGGAKKAGELDAQRAIRQAVQLAASL